MGRKSVVAEDLQMDVFDQACVALEIPEDKCQILREAAQEICTLKAKKKRKLSDYNIHMSKCVKEKSGPVKERFRSCVLEWKAKKKSQS